MDLRVLRYFLTVAREKSIVHAADVLHVTQPTLSRQLKDLEEEFGATLFVRGNKSQGLTLTEKGILLRRRAEELVELADRTREEMHSDDGLLAGDVWIGAGESDVMRLIAKAAFALQKQYPDIHYHLLSGNAEDIKERLDKGLLDFGVFAEPSDLQKYDKLRLPETDRWGLLARADSPLAQLSAIVPEQLSGLPVIVSRQQLFAKSHPVFPGVENKRLNIVATYNLIYNAALMTEEGFGYAITLEKLVKTDANSKLRFIPLKPQVELHWDIAWKKYQVSSKAAQAFLEKIREFCV